MSETKARASRNMWVSSAGKIIYWTGPSWSGATDDELKTKIKIGNHQTINFSIQTESKIYHQGNIITSSEKNISIQCELNFTSQPLNN